MGNVTFNLHGLSPSVHIKRIHPTPEFFPMPQINSLLTAISEYVPSPVYYFKNLFKVFQKPPAGKSSSSITCCRHFLITELRGRVKYRTYDKIANITPSQIKRPDKLFSIPKSRKMHPRITVDTPSNNNPPGDRKEKFPKTFRAGRRNKTLANPKIRGIKATVTLSLRVLECWFA
jgi:hypothetical protein